jgi:hypothetical protein
MKRVVGIALLIALTVIVHDAAQALPIVGASANTIPAGTFMLDTWGMWREFTVSWQGDGNGGAGWVGFPEDRKWTAGSLAFRVYYGVTDWLTVRASLPIEDAYRQYAYDEPSMSATGLGDVIIDPKIQLFRGDNGYPRISALAGVRFPTGSTDGEIPLSDGSTDFMGGAAITHREGDITGHACLVYWSNGEREGGTDVPDLIVGLASIETPLDTSWSLLWEFKGVYGETPSEFYRTYVCPGIMWSGDRLNVGFSTQVSMSAKGKPGISTLDYDWAPYFRIYYRFF